MATSIDSEFGMVQPFQTSAMFCQTCGMLLRLESTRSTITCQFCHTHTPVQSLVESDPFITKLELKSKDWLRDTEAADKAKRATIEHDCEKCGNNLMYFDSRQLRSVDEGQTVFYTCTKCGHTEAQNT